MFAHLETASNSNVDLNHWRSCYHQIIEILRKEYNATNNNATSMANSNPQTLIINNISRQPNSQQLGKSLKEQISKQLSAYLEEGYTFYAGLITSLENKYLKFTIDHFIDLNYYERMLGKRLDQSDTTIKTKDMKIALICINRCLISIGDLARYKEMIFNTSSLSSSLNSASSSSSMSGMETNTQVQSDYNAKILMTQQRDYSNARYYYLRAMAVAPKSSRVNILLYG